MTLTKLLKGLEKGVVYIISFKIDFDISKIEFRKDDLGKPSVIEYIGTHIYKKSELTAETFNSYKCYFNKDKKCFKEQKRRIQNMINGSYYNGELLVTKERVLWLKSLLKKKNWIEIKKTVNRKNFNSNLERKLKLQLLNFLGQTNGSMVSEFTHNNLKTRADMVVFGEGEVHVYELKSKNDKLSRLRNQIKDYSRYADFITIVINKKHWEQAKKMISMDIGVILEKNGVLERKRPAKKIESINRSFLLWKDEVVQFRKSDNFQKLTLEDQNKLVAIILESRFKDCSQEVDKNPLAIFKNRILKPGSKTSLKYTTQ